MPVTKLGYFPNGTFSVDSVISVVNRLFPLALELCKDKDRGGYFTLMSNARGVVLGSARIGEPPRRRSLSYLRFSIEKAVRLFKNKKHQTSRQSRDKKRKKYGGAIRGTRLIFSFSGLPEIWDEALNVATAVICGDLSFRRVEKITNRETRKAYHELLAAYYRKNRRKH